MDKIRLYEVFEKGFTDLKSMEPVKFEATFTNGTDKYTVNLFADGANRYLVRFLPQKTGQWDYSIDLDGNVVKGSFLCEGRDSNNHGLVKAIGDRFQYEDGTRYLPFGTTCYAWTHQTEELQQQTIDTLKASPYNKIRMCVFPKSMPYNENEPELFPFHKKEDGAWDVNQPNADFWHHLENRISQLGQLGIEADLILFHPYDRWGFSKFTHEEDLIYLKYCITRLSAFHNIWWSLANEFDFVPGKLFEEWDDFGNMVLAVDPYRHLTSIHNGFVVYPKKPWMTHCSIQGDAQKTITWKNKYDMPVLIDECGYEGDIEYSWGNLSAFEMVNRVWTAVTRGGYCTHGETYHRDDEVLWWAKGGLLYGESSERIAFLRKLLESIPENLQLVQKHLFNINPNDHKDSSNINTDNPIIKSLFSLPEHERDAHLLNFMPNMISSASYRLHYLGRQRPSIMDYTVPENGKYQIEVIDVWEMSRTLLHDEVAGNIKLRLPGKEGIAILVTRLEGDSLVD
ncbi:MAG TPA: DUF4038 domain-containing protein [Clostridiales bacterium]|nr:DUF4038 domain-containing protein [Clostridiales bacterium]